MKMGTRSIFLIYSKIDEEDYVGAVKLTLEFLGYEVVEEGTEMFEGVEVDSLLQSSLYTNGISTSFTCDQRSRPLSMTAEKKGRNRKNKRT
jgi:hypothetical protein